VDDLRYWRYRFYQNNMKKNLRLHRLPLRGFWGKNWSVVSEDEEGERFEFELESVEVANLTLAQNERLASGGHVVKFAGKNNRLSLIEVERLVPRLPN